MAATDADLNQLYIDHVQPIRDYLYRLSGDGSLAEDLVQETFYRAMRQLLGGSRVRFVSAWLYRIARNLYLDHVKRVRPDLEPHLGEESETDLGQPETEALRNEKQDQIALVLRQLAESQRTALVLRDVEGLSYEEIADAMDLTLSAVKSTIFRGRRRFSDLYSKLYLDQENGGSVHA